MDISELVIQKLPVDELRKLAELLGVSTEAKDWAQTAIGRVENAMRAKDVTVVRAAAEAVFAHEFGRAWERFEAAPPAVMKVRRVGASDVRMMAVLADVDPRSVQQTLRGKEVRGLAGIRIQGLFEAIRPKEPGWDGRLRAMWQAKHAT